MKVWRCGSTRTKATGLCPLPLNASVGALEDGSAWGCLSPVRYSTSLFLAPSLPLCHQRSQGSAPIQMQSVSCSPPLSLPLLLSLLGPAGLRLCSCSPGAWCYSSLRRNATMNTVLDSGQCQGLQRRSGIMTYSRTPSATSPPSFVCQLASDTSKHEQSTKAEIVVNAEPV